MSPASSSRSGDVPRASRESAAASSPCEPVASTTSTPALGDALVAAAATDYDKAEAELVKMPESDYMNEAQLDFFRARLHQMERDLLQMNDEENIPERLMPDKHYQLT